MPEYLAPGVYVEEVSYRSKSIEGVSTSTCAYVGPARKGPLSGSPEVMTSFAEFERVYGGLENLSFALANDGDPDVTNYLAHGARAFFDNGGKRLYVARCFVPRTDGGGAVVSHGRASALVVNSGGNQAGFFSRDPGSGGNGTIQVFSKATRVKPGAAMTRAPQGSLLCVGGAAPAVPARLVGGAPAFSLGNNDELGLILAGGTQTITFEGTGAEAAAPDALADPVDIPADTVFTVSIDGRAQTIALAPGSTAREDILSALNVGLAHGYARLEGDNLVIGTDKRGTDAQVSVPGIAVLGFTADDPATGSGTGNVRDLESVTVEEINSLLSAAGIGVRATVPPSTGLVNFSTTDAGAAVSLRIQDNPARISLGLPDSAVTGRDGTTPAYYQKQNQNWVGMDGATILDTAGLSGGEIITVNLVAVESDGNSIVYENLGLSPSHPRYLGHVLPETPAGRAQALENPYYFGVTGTLTPRDLYTGLFTGQAENSFALSGGNDGAEPTALSVTDGAVSYGDGLTLLEEIEDVSIVAAPGHSALASVSFEAVQDALISHAERMKYRIAVLDTPENQTVSQARDVRSRIDTSHGALYYPWVRVANPLARPGNDRIPKELPLPPSGFVTGIYARTDVNRGVWKPPANEVVRGALGFEREINHGRQEVLNPEGINCLRSFYGRGNRVWGARTASSDPEWKYVNVRRYFIYLERSIDRSTQWAVFEPNGLRLWSNITDTVAAFLYGEWQNNALLGTTPEQAFFVRCDRSTMTQNDLDNGRLICEIGVAAVKPAEFVIFRIGQKTADAG